MKTSDAAKELAEEARDYWIITPEPGYVVKTACRNVGSEPHPSKLFVNICHSTKIPPPMDGQWDEEDMLRKLETNPDDINIPTCVGVLEATKDLKGEPARKVDVVVNSIFYKKYVDKSEFYRQLLFMVVCSSIERQHNLIIEVKTHKTLRKNTHWGEISQQRIRKSPAECLIKEDHSSKCVDAEDLEPSPAISGQKFTATLVAGRIVEIVVQVQDEAKKSVKEAGRLRCKLNEDRVVVILDNKRSILDIFLPYHLNFNESDVEFDCKTSKLYIRCPIIW
uniref:PIH1 domain-containing protein n=1 Tax=Bursaphelenchus xylophilus TaxID=6326 RepID=A0A1I7RWX9_BURXY